MKVPAIQGARPNALQMAMIGEKAHSRKEVHAIHATALAQKQSLNCHEIQHRRGN